MKSRRRIAFLEAWDHASYVITAGIYDRRNGFRSSFCVAAILEPNVRFGSKADIDARPRYVRLPPKADIGTQSWNVRFVPKADIRAGLPKWSLDPT